MKEEWRDASYISGQRSVSAKTSPTQWIVAQCLKLRFRPTISRYLPAFDLHQLLMVRTVTSLTRHLSLLLHLCLLLCFQVTRAAAGDAPALSDSMSLDEIARALDA